MAPQRIAPPSQHIAAMGDEWGNTPSRRKMQVEGYSKQSQSCNKEIVTNAPNMANRKTRERGSSAVYLEKNNETNLLWWLQTDPRLSFIICVTKIKSKKNKCRKQNLTFLAWVSVSITVSSIRSVFSSVLSIVAPVLVLRSEVTTCPSLVLPPCPSNAGQQRTQSCRGCGGDVWLDELSSSLCFRLPWPTGCPPRNSLTWP